MNYESSLVNQLTGRLIVGELRPGARLSEAALAKEFDVSRNTLREAFRVLGEQGLVNHIPHRGVSVASPNTSDVIDIYRVRRHIECSVLEKAPKNHPGAEQMRRAVDTARSAAAADDWLQVGTVNMAFHNALVSLSDSTRLMRSFGNVLAELRLAFLKVEVLDFLHAPFVDRNQEVLDTYLNESPKAAAAKLDAYLGDSERQVLGAYARAGQD
ncbi:MULTISPECIES: GntR family transcriptional regulator [Brevibacterium]|uniref:Transcriptional regulator, GntR family n=1 Tax=Brevibacterium antiquum CNRZ 918 TaxID=1255637 RepID=A0A2H1JA26_9MICO|nr:MULTISPECIES: GntR family transcriptional regulator [Brevibacterium]SMX84253.1 transcriptional regulator, GntR family [Brevibacterium antiquum CNRZ 918]HCG54687.1 GntR family transcriptional regulator [Brevibacterium sp.]